MIFDNVKRLAEKQGLSIREVERRAGLENGAISKWVGNTSPRLENALKVKGGKLEKGLAVRGTEAEFCDAALDRWLV